MMDNEPCAASLTEAVITPQDGVFTAAPPHTGRAAHSYSLLVVVRYRASSPSDTQQSQPTSNLFVQSQETGASCAMKASTLRLLPANHTCPICFDLKETFLPARRRNKRWMQRGGIYSQHGVTFTSVNVGQRCFSDTSVSRCCESAWRLKISIAATESSKAFSLQTEREHPRRGSVTRIRVRCWMQSVTT